MKACAAGKRALPQSRRELAFLARSLFPKGPLILRTMLQVRPFICPFHRIIPLVPESSRVLDIGCGGGLFLGLLAECGLMIRGVGCDYSAAAIKLAREMHFTHRGSSSILSFYKANVDGELPEGGFDVVCLIDVLHHIRSPRQEAVFLAAAGKVRPGGLLLVKEIAPRPFLFAACNTLHDLVVARQVVHYIGEERLLEWGQKVGLAVCHRERVRMACYCHEVLVFRRLRIGPGENGP